MAASTTSQKSEDEKDHAVQNAPDSSELTTVPTKEYPPWSRVVPILFALYISLFLVALVRPSQNSVAMKLTISLGSNHYIDRYSENYR
jgi:hypothetical protein